MSMILDFAIHYAQNLGFAVLPTHGVIRGECACGNPDCVSPGKHPSTMHGLRDASNDPDVIINLFEGKPSPNLGVATGPISGIFVLDVDGAVGEASLARFPSLPETLSSTTGRGRHLFFRYPEGKKVFTRSSKFASGLDVRGEGGYVIAPPSQHYTGVRYQFIDPEAEIADAPDWLIEVACKGYEARKAISNYITTTPSELSEGWSVDDVRDMLAYIDPDITYSDWISIGMALHSGGHSLAIWDEWSQRGTKYSPGCTIPHWKSFKHNGGVSFGTLVHTAQMNGWKPQRDEPISLEDHPAREFLLRVKETFTIKKESGLKNDLYFLDPLLLPGLIGDTVREIVDTAQKPQPELAMMNVLAALGAVYGRRYCSPTDTRTNIYFIGIGPTGCGKDHSRRYMKRLLLEADLEIVLGGDAIVSGQGVLTDVHLRPSQIMHIDEYGMMLEAMSSERAAPHMRAATKILTELYSTSSGIYIGGQYADSKTERIRVPFPNLCIYATTTPERYLENLTRSSISSGELNRYIIMRTKMDMPERNRFAGTSKPSENIVSAWSALYPMPRMNCASIAPAPIKVCWTGLDDRIHEMGLFEDKKIMSSRSTGALWARYRENVIKVSMILAITRNTIVPVINGDDLDIAEAIVRQASVYTEDLVENFGRNAFSRLTEEILQKIQDFPYGCSRTDVTRATKNHKKKEVDEALAWLIEAGKIEAQKVATKGRNTTIYIIVNCEEDDDSG